MALMFPLRHGVNWGDVVAEWGQLFSGGSKKGSSTAKASVKKPVYRAPVWGSWEGLKDIYHALTTAKFGNTPASYLLQMVVYLVFDVALLSLVAAKWGAVEVNVPGLSSATTVASLLRFFFVDGAYGLFYTSFFAMTIFRLVSFVDHLRQCDHVFSYLTYETHWRKLMGWLGMPEKGKPAATGLKLLEVRCKQFLELSHALATGIVTHIITVVPWFVLIRVSEWTLDASLINGHDDHVATTTASSISLLTFLIPALLVSHVRTVFLETRIINHYFEQRDLNLWYVRDHYLGHHSLFDFLYFHGPHHDALPVGLIAVADNGPLEGLMRHAYCGHFDSFCDRTCLPLLSWGIALGVQAAVQAATKKPKKAGEEDAEKKVEDAVAPEPFQAFGVSFPGVSRYTIVDFTSLGSWMPPSPPGTVGRFTWQIIRDIVGHQYVPGVLPYSFPSIFAGVHHVEHHMFSLYPLGNGFDAGWNPANVGGASESNAVAAHLEEESKIGKCDNVLDNVVFDVWMADGIIAPAKCKGEGKGLSTVEGYEDDRGDGAKGGELDCAESSPAKSRGRYNPDNAIWKRHLDMSREHEKWAW